MTQENNSKLYIENSSLFIGGNVVSTYADVSGFIDDFGIILILNWLMGLVSL